MKNYGHTYLFQEEFILYNVTLRVLTLIEYWLTKKPSEIMFTLSSLLIPETVETLLVRDITGPLKILPRC